MSYWTDIVDWDTGDFITKGRMDHMINQAKNVKEEGPDFQTVLASDVTSSGPSVIHNGPLQVWIGRTNTYSHGTMIGEYSYGVSSGTTDFTMIYPGVGSGDWILHFVLDTTDTDVPQIVQRRFVKTENMNYLSMWLTPFHNTIGLLNHNIHGAHSVTVILHRETQGWTV